MNNVLNKIKKIFKKKKPQLKKKKYLYRLVIRLKNQEPLTIRKWNLPKKRALTPFIRFIKWYYKRPQSETYRFDFPHDSRLVRRCDIIGYYTKREEQIKP